MMSKLQDMKQQATNAKDELASIIIESHSDDQKIKIKLSADKKIHDLQISQDLCQDSEELEDRLVLQLNKALASADDLSQEHMAKISAGLSAIPGMDKFMK